MRKNLEKKSIVQFCPIRNVVARFGNKWALLVLLVLDEERCVRFNQLCRLIPDISAKMLSATLHILEADGLIVRKVYAEIPPRVEYRLTATGLSLIPFIRALTDWAKTHMADILSHRADFATVPSAASPRADCECAD